MGETLDFSSTITRLVAAASAITTVSVQTSTIDNQSVHNSSATTILYARSNIGQ